MANPVNYCSWLVRSYCVTQGEWAAWTQAFGSIIALAIAIAIPIMLHRKAQAAQMASNELDRLEREHLARYQAKASAIAILPAARDFHSGLKEVLAQIYDPWIEDYTDVDTSRMTEKLSGFRAQTEQLATMGDTGEMAMNAIASVEALLRSFDEWEFYERYTDQGVIEDLERGYYEKFDEPPALSPMVQTSIDRMEIFLTKVDAMFA
ncbi:hypothetical protein ACIGEO_18575 [Stenotrophomonas bentonitica]|uniref:hypothetical protein n=1 Tax=Stenotrophomonas bentonitica TaxID=1450134 RepID=UPI0037CF55F6